MTLSPSYLSSLKRRAHFQRREKSDRERELKEQVRAAKLQELDESQLLGRDEIRQIFNDFCVEKDLTKRIMNKMDAQLGIYWERGRKTASPLGSAIMIAEFGCGHNLLTSTSNLGRLKDKTQNKVCPICRKAYYFNNLNSDDWELYGVIAYATRSLNNELLHRFKPKKNPLDIYVDKEELIKQYIEAAKNYPEVTEVERITDFSTTDRVEMAIYMFVGDDCRAYIGSSNNLHTRWHTSLNYLYGFNKDDMTCVLMRVHPTTNITRLREIEIELVRYFKLADGLGYNTSGSAETSTQNPFKWVL